MSFFIRATPAPKPKTKNIRVISILAAAILIIMVVTQLFTFEDFPSVLAMLGFPGGNFTAKVLATVLVISEVFALPFLLAMPLSPLFRVASMILGWFAAVAWLKISLWENLVVHGSSGSSIFGATLPMPIGWWSVFFSLALFVLIVWASWGMWPMAAKHVSKINKRG